MYREIVILLGSPQYFFPLLALVSLSRRLSSDVFSARRALFVSRASVALTNEPAIVATSFFFFLFAVEHAA